LRKEKENFNTNWRKVIQSNTKKTGKFVHFCTWTRRLFLEICRIFHGL